MADFCRPFFVINITMDNKQVYFNIAEKEIIELLVEEFKITHLQACTQVIAQKREAAWRYSQRGNFDLAEHMLREICEWNDEVEKDFVNRGRGVIDKEIKIIMPGEE